MSARSPAIRASSVLGAEAAQGDVAEAGARPGRVGDGGADLAEPPCRALDEAARREAQTEDEEVHAVVFPA